MHYPYDYGDQNEKTNFRIVVIMIFFLIVCCNWKPIAKNLIFFGGGLTDELKIRLNQSYSYIYNDVLSLINQIY